MDVGYRRKHPVGASTCYRGPGHPGLGEYGGKEQGRYLTYLSTQVSSYVQVKVVRRPIGVHAPTIVSGSAAEPRPPCVQPLPARLSPKRPPAGPALQRCRHVTIRYHAAPTQAPCEKHAEVPPRMDLGPPPLEPLATSRSSRETPR